MNHAIILAAGKGTRFSADEDKLFLVAAEHPIIYYTLMAFNDHPEIDSITIVCSPENKKELRKLVKKYRFPKVKNFTFGGNSWSGSFIKGLASIKAEESDIILAHNGANPLVSSMEITESIHKAKETGAAIVGHFATSTIKEVNDQHIVKTHDRHKIFAAETPQVARYSLIKHLQDDSATDLAMMLEATGHKVSFVEASKDNFKVTYHQDFEKLKAVLGHQPDDFLVGIGQDSHMFDEEQQNHLVIAGLLLQDHPKLLGNSDGDVVLHAIFNAISQVLGGKSIGFYADQQCREGIIDSREYLKPLLKELREKDLEINNLSLMFECKRPLIDPISHNLKKSLSKLLDLPAHRIGITATSGEQSFYGRGKGIQCFAMMSFIRY